MLLSPPERLPVSCMVRLIQTVGVPDDRSIESRGDCNLTLTAVLDGVTLISGIGTVNIAMPELSCIQSLGILSFYIRTDLMVMSNVGLGRAVTQIRAAEGLISAATITKGILIMHKD